VLFFAGLFGSATGKVCKRVDVHCSIALTSLRDHERIRGPETTESNKRARTVTVGATDAERRQLGNTARIKLAETYWKMQT
jgi:hypothetical protein